MLKVPVVPVENLEEYAEMLRRLGKGATFEPDEKPPEPTEYIAARVKLRAARGHSDKQRGG